MKEKALLREDDGGKEGGPGSRSNPIRPPIPVASPQATKSASGPTAW
jgi:hypothetical protein